MDSGLTNKLIEIVAENASRLAFWWILFTVVEYAVCGILFILFIWAVMIYRELGDD